MSCTKPSTVQVSARFSSFISQKHTGVFYLAMSILIMMLLPIFYVLVYLYQREMRKGTQQLKFVSKPQKKTKPS